MKKLLIAAAAMTVVAGAQAQSTATIYGTLDVGYGNFNQQVGSAAKTTQKGLMYNTNDSSRWGIKAEEDLGGGSKAGVQIESWLGSLPRNNFGYNGGSASAYGVSSGTSNASLNGVGNSIDATSLGNRILAAHVTMGAHTVQAGYNSAFVRDIAVPYQADGSNVVGNLVGNDATITGRNVAANYIYNANGLTAGVGVTNNVKQRDGYQDVNTGSGYQLKARYATGPMSVAAAYSVATSDTGTTTNPTVSSTTTQLNSPVVLLGTGTQVKTKTKTTVLAADYDLTVAKLFAEYGKVDVTNENADATLNNRHAVSVGARVPVGKAWFFAQVSEGKQQNTTGYDGDWKGYSVGARYELSKRTYAYIVNGESKYDYTATSQLKAKQYGAGLVHNF